MYNVSVIILAFNEELHIRRVIENCLDFSSDIHVVDSGSTDQTVAICSEYKVNIYKNPWINYASQFNWALDNCDIKCQWILRLDADEYVPNPEKLSFYTTNPPQEIVAYTLRRYMKFQGKKIRFGGMFPIPMLRLFRKGYGRCEQRWMDEHITVTGNISDSKVDIVDDSLKGLRWWIDKHAWYANREVIDILLDDKYIVNTNYRNRIKRFLKMELYYKIPFFCGPLLYFLYRYIIRLGFLDGVNGLAFHFLQGFWYRFLVEYQLRATKKLIANGENMDNIKLKLLDKN